MSVRRLTFSLVCAVAIATLGCLNTEINAVFGAVVPNKGQDDFEPSAVITQTIVSDVDTNLSRFLPSLLAEVRLSEQAAMMQGLILATDISSETPTAVVEKEEFMVVDPAA
ncbi:hypothetical protein EV178_005547 [Coemansia sp. RSA 1646]|nr:hypothetical protein EV178_005547 [Coemansia sp. RSA 1646]